MKITLYPKYLIRRMFVHGRHDFFKAGYKLLYPEYSRHGMSPWQHYVIDGKRKGFDNGNHPSDAVFLREGYEIEYPDVKAAGVDPWRHYAEKGFYEGRDNGHHPKEAQFFGAGYLEMYPDVAKSGMDPWHHYVLHGKKEGRDNGHHPKEAQFFGAGYLEMYPDVAKSGMDPWRHYVLHGKKEGRDNGHHPKEAQFFGAGYLEMYPDVAKSGMDPWRHYVQYGKKEGRDTGYCPKDNVFCAIGYLRLYPDVAKLNIDPWLHYVRYGKIEGRQKITTPYKYVKAYKKLWYLDKKAIDDKLKKFVGEGISDNQTQIIVSLTSFPARIEEVKYTIYSLLNQSFKPNKVVLWLAVEEFPHKEKDLPADLLKLRQNGLSIEWCNDIKSYKKLIPAIKKYKNSIIVTADDDIYYQEDWLKKLYVDHMIYPRDIIAHRCHYISVKNEIPISYSKWSKSVISSQASFRLFITGCGGVLYPPNCLYSDVTDDKIFMRLCPTTDDIWFWGMAVLNNRKLRCVKNPENNIIYVNLDKELNHEFTLGSVNLVQGGNDKQLAALLDNYPGLYKKLNCEKDIKVSIIIPVWNAEKYISKCLDSLINQTLKDIEIICVNDGSTDNSLNVLKEYSRKDPRIKIINQQNQGQSVARNNAMDVAQGEFIGFCDNDDWVSKNYFEDLYKSAIDNKADIAATPNVFYVDPVTNKITKKNTGIESREQFISDRGKVVITTALQWNKIYKADFLKRNNIRCTTIRVAAEDNYFTVQAMMYCHKISVETKAEYYFYRRTNATSNLTKTKKDFCVVDLYKSIDKLIQESSLDENDKESWLNVLKKRKTGDLSLFYNEMEVIYKDDFKKYVAKEFPDIELKLRR